MKTQDLYNAVLVRHSGEIGIKSRKTRSRMVWLLNKAIREKIAHFDVKSVENYQTRTIISSKEPSTIAKHVASYIPGVHSASPVLMVFSTSLEVLSTEIVRYALTLLKSGMSFGIKVRRSGTHSFTSMELGKILGSAVFEGASAVGLKNTTVDLKTPDRMIFVEVKENRTFISHEFFYGFEGLPLGTQGIVFGGLRPWLEDYIAVGLMLRKGVYVSPVFFKTGLESFFEKEKDSLYNLLPNNLRQSATVIDLESDFLIQWKEKFTSEELCQACHLFTEALLEEACVSQQDKIGIVTGTSLNDTHPTVIRFLDLITGAPRFRPGLLSLSNLPRHPQGLFQETKDRARSCCRLQTQRYGAPLSEAVLLHSETIRKLAHDLVERHFIPNTHLQQISDEMKPSYS
ncbi:MAG TPA: THUMP domain-containing protein [Candidatus Hodarchaeales archaeon]|nr:THUMP domain-containing protein [Candidatus Hodarchaeales archaeon]